MSIDDADQHDWDMLTHGASFQARMKAAMYDEIPKRPRDPNKTQIGGDHYKGKKFQPIDYITGNGLDFMEGNVIKYITRHRDKNGEEDVLKALHYCKLILKHTYGKEDYS